MASRKDILVKIKALLAKTVANGCTEAEAFAALAKAQAMMSAHDISDEDLTFGGEGAEKASRVVSDRDRIRDRLKTAVGHFTHCVSWSGPVLDEISFCGLDSDTVFAHWLLDTLADFVSRELCAFLSRTWSPSSPRFRRVETDGFVDGCCARISERLDELAAAGLPVPGKGLVVARNSLIERRLNELGINLQRARGRFKFVDIGAQRAGEASGNRASFNRPIERDGPDQYLT